MANDQLVKYPFPVKDKGTIQRYIKAVNQAQDALRLRAQVADAEELEEVDDNLEALRALKFTLETIYHIGIPIR